MWALSASRCFVPDSLLVYPAPSYLLDGVAGDRWLAVGDAAAAYDPISSQGIHKPLSDGLQAAEAIAAVLEGDTQRLDEYRSSVAARFDNYLSVRNYFHGQEQRWPNSPFWPVTLYLLGYPTTVALWRPGHDGHLHPQISPQTV